MYIRNWFLSENWRSLSVALQKRQTLDYHQLETTRIFFHMHIIYVSIGITSKDVHSIVLIKLLLQLKPLLTSSMNVHNEYILFIGVIDSLSTTHFNHIMRTCRLSIQTHIKTITTMPNKNYRKLRHKSYEMTFDHRNADIRAKYIRWPRK